MAKKEETRVSVGGWMGTILLSLLPLVNVVLWFAWAFTAKKPSRRTFAWACLILTLIAAGIAAVCVTLWGAQILEWARSLDPELFTAPLAK